MEMKKQNLSFLIEQQMIPGGNYQLSSVFLISYQTNETWMAFTYLCAKWNLWGTPSDNSSKNKLKKSPKDRYENNDERQ